jgi:hypothetical protein
MTLKPKECTHGLPDKSRRGAETAKAPFGDGFCRSQSSNPLKTIIHEKDPYRLPRGGAERSGLKDCHSRICSETSFFSCSLVALSHRRRSSSRRPSTNPTRPDLRSGLSRLLYLIVQIAPLRFENIATDPTCATRARVVSIVPCCGLRWLRRGKVSRLNWKLVPHKWLGRVICGNWARDV